MKIICKYCGKEIKYDFIEVNLGGYEENDSIDIIINSRNSKSFYNPTGLYCDLICYFKKIKKLARRG